MDMARTLSFNAPLFPKRTAASDAYNPEIAATNQRFDHCCMIDPDFDTGIVASEIEIIPGVTCTFDSQTYEPRLEYKR